MILIEKKDHDIESESDGDPPRAQYQRLLEGYRASPSMKYTEIQCHQEEYESNECHPQPHQEPSRFRRSLSAGAAPPFCTYCTYRTNPTGSPALRIDRGQVAKELCGG